MAGPVPVDATGNRDVDGILWGYKWDARSLTYAFPASTAEYLKDGYVGIEGFRAFDAAQQAAVKAILASIASFTGLTFRDVSGTATKGLLRFAEADRMNYTDDEDVALETGWHVPGSASAEANPPELGFDGAAPYSAPYAQGDGWYSRGEYRSVHKGGFAYCAGLMHETGHNLGLKHGHVKQDGHGTLFPELPYDHDSLEYSVMTYRQFPGHHGEFDDARFHPTTYMQDDILALQTLYGANYAHQAGKTVYRWSAETGEMFVNGVGQGAPDSNHILMTVWDGGGEDTYDLSNYTGDTVINLRPGAWTTTAKAQLADLGTNGGEGPVHYARGTVANALLFERDTAALIENAVGGSGNDRIVGNQAANLLDGGRGADRLVGGAGDDTYVVDRGGDRVLEGAGQGHDTVLSGSSYRLGAGQEIETLQLLLATRKAALDLTGNAFAQTIRGNHGRNVLDGKDGADLLTGKGDADTFVFSTKLGAGNVDHITDFSATDDTIRLSDDIFAALSPGRLAESAFRTVADAASAVTDRDDRILSDRATGDLFYDANGGDAGARVKFAVIDTHAALTARDIMVA